MALAFSYLSSTRLVLDVVNRSNLGAHVFQIRCWRVDGSRRPGRTGPRWLLLQRGLLGHGGFGDDSATMSGFAISGGGWGSRSSSGSWARAGYKKREAHQG